MSGFERGCEEKCKDEGYLCEKSCFYEYLAPLYEEEEYRIKYYQCVEQCRKETQECLAKCGRTERNSS